MIIAYYSSVSENTHRFVKKLGLKSVRIPIKYEELTIDEPYILITPTYLTTKRALPPSVVQFLNNKSNRGKMRGVIGTGNTNFNKDYCLGAKIVSAKCKVPHLYNLELLGTPEDVQMVQEIVKNMEEKEKTQS